MKPTILVIDDEEGICDLLAMLLHHKGYVVLLAENGRKGLDLFRCERPDVIVLDLNLPEMDGITVLQDIRGIDTKTPVVIFKRRRGKHENSAWRQFLQRDTHSISWKKSYGVSCRVVRIHRPAMSRGQSHSIKAR